MTSFKHFFGNPSAPEMEPVKWNVVLFTGEFNPICREEFHRITDFIKNYVRSNPTKVDENADIGLLTSSESLNEINTKMRYELTFEERQFLTGKLFGFKMFPVDMNELFSLAHLDKDKALQSKVNTASKFFREQFEESNILIVVRPNEGNIQNDMQQVSHAFSENGLNIGFITYDHTPITNDEYFKKIPVNGDMLKACCLLDADRPDALSLKNFAYKYNLQNHLDKIKVMHFITRNESYELAFRHLFPEVRLHERSNEEQEYNVRTVMEIVKKMYTSKNT